MPVDPKRVQALIDELNLEGADKDYFTKVLTTNENAATQFVGQRERHDQFTRRTQELSTKEKDLERRANEQITEYAQQLEAADKRIKKIMSDFERAEISRATAEARLLKVKEIYNLSDDDIPKVEAPKGDTPPATSAIDIDAKLTQFEDRLMRRLLPELLSLPKVSAILDDLDHQHMELTGKRLSLADKESLMAETQKENGPNLVQAWESKYEIPKIRKERERADWSKEERVKWDDEQKKKNSEDALRGVRRGADGKFQSQSPVFREYETHTEGADRFVQKPAPQQGERPQDQRQGGPKLSGAERAAQKFLERRNAGIPMGKEAPAGNQQ